MNIFLLIGGLAMFLYGMQTMGEGLSKLAGSRLEHALARLTSNKYKALFLGLFTTAVIQSSSATTVMVVGLVNSGLLKLFEAVPVIMGANTGTTITAWILSLTGIDSSNFFVQLLNPKTFSPILAFIGIVLIMGSKIERRRTVGTLFIGFAILMFGMGAMSDALAPLSQSPEFIKFFTYFSNPLLGVLAGAVLTAVIQSSSASIGILQSLSLSGIVPYASAIPIILGQNIGTCVTAMISGIGARRNARRAALVHLYYNVAGSVIFLALFYALHYFVNFAFMHQNAGIMGIAVIHTVFNVLATIVLLPFSKQLEKLARLSIREGRGKPESYLEKITEHLDPRFLATPAIALEQCRDVMHQMSRFSLDSVKKATQLYRNYEDSVYEEVDFLENSIDRLEDVVGSYLLKLSRQDITDFEHREITIMMHGVNDFERISDHAINIAKTAKTVHESQDSFSEQALLELDVYCEAVVDIVEQTVHVFKKNDATLAAGIEPLEEVIDDLNQVLSTRHVRRLQAGECMVDMGILFYDTIGRLERIADHCSNVAVSIIEIAEGCYSTHEYHMKVHKSNEPFRKAYSEYREKYVLPAASSGSQE
ncbi:MAG: Na/Pi cotransporter family protein [Bradymonadales bacterium]|jgi:phosphate:Na+ symporter